MRKPIIGILIITLALMIGALLDGASDMGQPNPKPVIETRTN